MVVSSLTVAGMLAALLAGRRHEFAAALSGTPAWVPTMTAALQPPFVTASTSPT
jgi:hypothetical protein